MSRLATATTREPFAAHKVREGGRVVTVHGMLACELNADGHREILGVQVTSAEDGSAKLAKQT